MLELEPLASAVLRVADQDIVRHADMESAYVDPRHVDVYLPPGTARLKQGGGHGGHNGLRDIFRHTADHGFLRLRIGIGHPGCKDAVPDDLR